MALDTQEKRHALLGLLPVADGADMDTLIQRGIMLGLWVLNTLSAPVPPNETDSGLDMIMDFWE